MTIRSKAQLATLLADNSTGSITPSNVRDIVDSTTVRSVAMVSTVPHLQATANNAWELITDVNTFFDSGQGQFSGPSTCRITNISPTSVSFSLVVILAAVIDDLGNGREGQIAIAKNGVIQDSSISSLTGRGTSNPVGLTSIAGIDLAPTDYMEGFVRTPQGADSIDWQQVRLAITTATIL